MPVYPPPRALEVAQDRLTEKTFFQLLGVPTPPFAAVESREQFVEAVAALIHGDATADSPDWTIAYELYLAALREPALRVVTQRWMNQRAHARICLGEASMCRCEHTQ